MNLKQIGWSRRYRTALRKFVKEEPTASLQSALRLGRQAVALKMETLDLSMIHKKSMMGLILPGDPAMTRHIVVDRARSFFAETIVPIEKTHRAALKDNDRVNQLTRTLRRRTAESSASTRNLKRGVARRRKAERALKKSGEDRAGLLEKSSRLQKSLRRQTRKVLSVQENRRRRSSRVLHNKIAQTLLAINIRLLALKASRKASTEHLEKEIADTERFVKQSVSVTRRLAQKFGVSHET